MRDVVDPTRVIIDTSILFSALLPRESSLRERILTDSGHVFYSPRFVLVEIFKHKERIAAATELDAEELLDSLNALLARIKFVEEGVIPVGTWMEGRRLCAGIDQKDAPFVTLTLHMDGLLWTNDGQLKLGLRPRGFDRFFGQ